MKKIISIVILCIFSLVLTAGNIVTEADYFSEKESIKSVVTEADCFSEENISMDDYITYIKNGEENSYCDYIISTLESVIKNIDGILDCKININSLDHKSVVVNVKVITEDGKDDVMQTNMKDYISQYLDISYEKILLTFN